MTKTTLKALFAGSGLLATWLFVTPGDTPSTSSPPETQTRAAAREQADDELQQRAARLRQRDAAQPMRRSTRNPFRFGSSRPRVPAGAPKPAVPLKAEPSPPIPAPGPSLKLFGVAERNTSEGRKRTATITADGQLYVVGEGQSVAGRYTVVTVDPDAVLLRDQDGAEVRLTLP